MDLVIQKKMENGNSYYHSNDYKKAIDCYDQILQIYPKDTDILNNKGSAYDYL